MPRSALLIFFLLAATTGLAQDAALQPLEQQEITHNWSAVGRLNIGPNRFCTGSLIAPNLVLTAAHCLFDTETQEPVAPESIQFLAGWRKGRATAYRKISRVVVHSDYFATGEASAERVSKDLAFLELKKPIRNTYIIPFDTGKEPRTGDRVGVVSYAQGRSEAPSLQDVCTINSYNEGVLVTSCLVDFGASGSPIFSFQNGKPYIVSVVSALAEVNSKRVSLGAGLVGSLNELQAQFSRIGRISNSVYVGGTRRDIGAKFIKP